MILHKIKAFLHTESLELPGDPHGCQHWSSHQDVASEYVPRRWKWWGNGEEMVGKSAWKRHQNWGSLGRESCRFRGFFKHGRSDIVGYSIRIVHWSGIFNRETNGYRTIVNQESDMVSVVFSAWSFCFSRQFNTIFLASPKRLKNGETMAQQKWQTWGFAKRSVNSPMKRPWSM